MKKNGLILAVVLIGGAANAKDGDFDQKVKNMKIKAIQGKGQVVLKKHVQKKKNMIVPTKKKMELKSIDK